MKKLLINEKQNLYIEDALFYYLEKQFTNCTNYNGVIADIVLSDAQKTSFCICNDRVYIVNNYETLARLLSFKQFKMYDYKITIKRFSHFASNDFKITMTEPEFNTKTTYYIYDIKL